MEKTITTINAIAEITWFVKASSHFAVIRQPKRSRIDRLWVNALVLLNESLTRIFFYRRFKIQEWLKLSSVKMNPLNQPYVALSVKLPKQAFIQISRSINFLKRPRKSTNGKKQRAEDSVPVVVKRNESLSCEINPSHCERGLFLLNFVTWFFERVFSTVFVFLRVILALNARDFRKRKRKPPQIFLLAQN